MYDSRLKRCPICGAPADLWFWRFGVVVECSLYDVETHRVAVEAKTREEAIRLWNTRLEYRGDGLW